MTLLPCSEAAAARWITSSRWPWDRLVTFGPEGFEAYARLRVIPDPEHEGQHEGDVAPLTSLSEIEQVSIALALLGAHTRTPEDCYVAWWDGWPGTVAGFAASDLEGARFDVPHRSYFLLHGSLTGFESWARRAEAASEYSPAFVWPADHAWCLAFDVDPHWAGIGASSAAVQDVRSDPRLDVVSADPERAQPAYS